VSPSSNRGAASSGGRPQDSWASAFRFAASRAAGLSVGREHVSYVEIAKTAQKWVLRHVGEARINGRLFAGAGETAASAAALVPALTAAVGEQAPRFGPLHVSVPDAAVRVNLFELDAVPASRAAQDAFVEFRMGRESGGATKYRYVSQPLGRGNNGKPFLLGLALEERWYLAIEAALQEAGVRAWSLNANGLRQFNLHHEKIRVRGGALVTLEPDTWSLLVWDAGGLLRYSRAQWRVDDLDAKEIAAEIERSILGYVHGESGRAVEQIWICAGTGAAELSELLNARASTPCQVLNTAAHLDTAQDVLRYEAALAAALQS
jgi:Tfp pilus assembly PilM family ATPase